MNLKFQKNHLYLKNLKFQMNHQLPEVPDEPEEPEVPEEPEIPEEPEEPDEFRLNHLISFPFTTIPFDELDRRPYNLIDC